MRKPKRQSYWRLVARQFRRNRLSVPALCLVLLLFAVALAAPFLAGDKPIYMVMNGRTFFLPNVINYP